MDDLQNQSPKRGLTTKDRRNFHHFATFHSIPDHFPVGGSRSANPHPP